jgi:hypothetical protein
MFVNFVDLVNVLLLVVTSICTDTLGTNVLCDLIAGAGGGLVASIATCPLDVVKTKLQAQRAIQGQRGYLGVVGLFP